MAKAAGRGSGGSVSQSETQMIWTMLQRFSANMKSDQNQNIRGHTSSRHTSRTNPAAHTYLLTGCEVVE